MNKKKNTKKDELPKKLYCLCIKRSPADGGAK